MILEDSEISDEMMELLGKMGFSQKENKWVHDLIPSIEFDFSAAAMEGVVKMVFERGMAHGSYLKQRQIIEAIDGPLVVR